MTSIHYDTAISRLVSVYKKIRLIMSITICTTPIEQLFFTIPNNPYIEYSH